MGRTQPAISALIANLETELNITLFRRQRGKMSPTPEALYFLGEADAILDRLALSTRTMREIGALEKGRLNIASMPAAASMLMPQLLADFLKDKPDVQASLMMRASAVIAEWITSQQYDIGLGETPSNSAAIDMQNLELECVCAIAADDPLAAKSVIQAKDLSGKPMAALQDGHQNLKATQRAFAEQNSKFEHRFELRNFQPALPLVEKKLCYCVCDPITAAGYLKMQPSPRPVVFRPFKPSVVLKVSIMQPAHKPPSGLAKAFAELLRKELDGINSLFDCD